MRRVSIITHRNDWTETEKDAVRVLECYLAHRGWSRPGQVMEVPLTVGHIRFWLRLTRARRRGRDYARTILTTLERLELIRDTGTVMKPTRQPKDRAHSYWWRVYTILPVLRRANPGAYPDPSAPLSTVSLCRFLTGQGLLRRPRSPRRASIQWVFLHSGPP
jgi:hypothetical protein